MNFSREECGYLADGVTASARCRRPAIYRSLRNSRCETHIGHLEFTERKDGRWLTN